MYKMACSIKKEVKHSTHNPFQKFDNTENNVIHKMAGSSRKELEDILIILRLGVWIHAATRNGKEIILNKIVK